MGVVAKHQPRVQSLEDTHYTGLQVEEYDLLLTPAEVVHNGGYYFGGCEICSIDIGAIDEVIDCTHIYGADFTAAKVISTMVMDFKLREQPLFFYNLQPRVAQVFEGLNKDLVVIYDISTLHAKLAEKSPPI